MKCDDVLGVFKGALGEGRSESAASNGVFVLIDHHLDTGGTGGDVESLVPLAFFDVGFGAVEGLKGRYGADGELNGQCQVNSSPKRNTEGAMVGCHLRC